MTALTGSSHGFFSYVAKNLIDSAVNYGLERNLAERAIRQALKGMGKLIGDEESSPHETIDFLTSYGGTTITEAALASLERDKLNEVISRAIEAGYRKATEVV
jgi:pyrroline-5-carboxylate reductase